MKVNTRPKCEDGAAAVEGRDREVAYPLVHGFITPAKSYENP